MYYVMLGYEDCVCVYAINSVDIICCVLPVVNL